MKNLREATKNEINDFEKLSNDIFKFLNKHWDIEVKPKKYDKYLETYEDYKDVDKMGKHEKDFKGFGPNGDCYSLPENLSLPNTAYSDTQQGRTPLQTLIGAILTYGLQIGKYRKEISKDELDDFRELVENFKKNKTDENDE